MAMPQQDNYIEQIRRLEGLMSYAEAHGDWEELERLYKMSLFVMVYAHG